MEPPQAGGLGHSVMRASDGTVWTVGANGSGQLGLNNLTTYSTPVQVPGLTDVIAVAAGNAHTLALTSGGLVYVWGSNFYGQVGDNSTTNRLAPVQSSLTSVPNWCACPRNPSATSGGCPMAASRSSVSRISRRLAAAGCFSPKCEIRRAGQSP